MSTSFSKLISQKEILLPLRQLLVNFVYILIIMHTIVVEPIVFVYGLRVSRLGVMLRVNHVCVEHS